MESLASFRNWCISMDDHPAIRPMIERDLDQVLAWRNHPDIRRLMLTQHEINPKEHHDWFERVSKDPLAKLLIIEEKQISLGFVSLTGLEVGGIAEWGFYKAPDAPKGAGRKVGIAALNYVFRDLKVHKVCGQALAFNEMSIRYHRSLGFKQEGVLRDQYKIGGVYHNLFCFGLLSHEWQMGN